MALLWRLSLYYYYIDVVMIIGIMLHVLILVIINTVLIQNNWEKLNLQL